VRNQEPRIVAAILLVLIAAFPAQLLSDHLHADGVMGPTENTGEVSLLLKNYHDFQPDEIRLLTRFGLVSTVAGPLAVVHTQSPSALPSLPFIERIEKSRPLRVYLDKSVPDVGADLVWQNVKDLYGRNVTGAGVVIGFVDTGIDLAHPDFRFPNGTTKILHVWDQTIRGRSPIGFGYGHECSSDDIQGNACPEYDSYGHGTHVAGIAAGSGQATGNYTGVAPDAGIIFVKSGYEVCNGASWTFDSAQILDGINYIVKKAAQIGRRAVINLSLGGNIGSHDGRDPFEEGLDAFVKQGVVVVVAAGNQAQDDSHARGQLSEGNSVTMNLIVRETTTALQIDIWYGLEDDSEAVLTTPDGQTFGMEAQYGGTSRYGRVFVQTGSNNLGKELYLEVVGNGTLPSDGWSVTLKNRRVRSNGVWDAWIDTSGCAFPGASFTPGDGYVIDPYGSIGIPGTAEYVVTVGAHFTKTSWKTMDGRTREIKGAQLGEIAPFSSLGPTRDGRIKPDVTAPGILIASARSSAVPQSDSDPDPFHRILAGTSMATPHVAGVVALMFQLDPNLDATVVPKLLRESSRLDKHTGIIKGGSPTWGFGKVDCRTATGFYFRVTVAPQPSLTSVNVPVYVDGVNRTESLEGDWISLYFPVGTAHTITLDATLQAEDRVRYVLSNRSFGVKSNSLLLLNYTTQYLLTLSSQFGPTTGSGWYDANSTATINAPKRLEVAGWLRYLGAEYVFLEWRSEQGEKFDDSVLMDQPRKLVAVYVLTYPFEAIWLVLASTLLVAAALLILIRFGKKR